MKDITTFLEKKSFKEILQWVYKKDNVAVATDSFKLIEIKLDDFCTEHIPNGYYEIDSWKKMCKAYNAKKQDLKTFSETIIQNNAIMSKWSDTEYPDYKRVIVGDFKEMDINSSFTKKHLIAFIEMLPELDRQTIKLSDLKDNGKMIKFENNDTLMILMKCNK